MTFHFHALEEEIATHSSVLAWRIPGTGEPGGLPSMGSHGVRHDWSDLAAAAAALLTVYVTPSSLFTYLHYYLSYLTTHSVNDGILYLLFTIVTPVDKLKVHHLNEWMNT